jgi:xanthosine utilization system XapX-like protein
LRSWVDSPEYVMDTDPAHLETWFWTGFDVQRPWAKGKVGCPAWVDADYYDFERSAENVRVEYRPRGKQRPGMQAVYVVSGSATPVEAYPDNVQWFGWPYVNLPEVPKPSIGVTDFKRNLGADGLAYAGFRANKAVDVTFQVGRPYYDFWPSADQHQLIVSANTVPLEPDHLVPSSEFCVGQLVMFDPDFYPPLSGVTDKTVKWTFDGTFVNEIIPPVEYDDSPQYIMNPAILTLECRSNEFAKRPILILCRQFPVSAVRQRRHVPVPVHRHEILQTPTLNVCHPQQSSHALLRAGKIQAPQVIPLRGIVAVQFGQQVPPVIQKLPVQCRSTRSRRVVPHLLAYPPALPVILEVNPLLRSVRRIGHHPN